MPEWDVSVFLLRLFSMDFLCMSPFPEIPVPFDLLISDDGLLGGGLRSGRGLRGVVRVWGLMFRFLWATSLVLVIVAWRRTK